MYDPAGLARCGSEAKMQSVRCPVGEPSIEHRQTKETKTSLRDRKQTISNYMPFFDAATDAKRVRGRDHLTHVTTLIKNQFLISLSYRARTGEDNDRSHNSQHKQSTSITIAIRSFTSASNLSILIAADWLGWWQR